MNSGIITKGEFAARLGVSAARVSQFVSEKKIHGPALVGSGRKARINVAVALAQLDKNLDISQRTGMNAKAKLDAGKPAASAVKPSPAAIAASTPSGAISEPHPRGDDDDDYPGPVEEQIKRQRLEQISLANAKAREEASARSGRFVRADDARREAGRISGRLLTIFDAAIVEFSNAIAAAPPTSSRAALRLLRSTWRGIRVRQASAIGAEAQALPALLEDEEEKKNVSNS
jgi:hypothetical protein